MTKSFYLGLGDNLFPTSNTRPFFCFLSNMCAIIDFIIFVGGTFWVPYATMEMSSAFWPQINNIEQ